MSLAQIIETSGVIQLTLAVLLGWPIYLHRASPRLQAMIPNRARLLQTHMDDILMGILQIVLASHVAAGGLILTSLFIFGSWLNAKVFLFLAVSDDRCASRTWFRVISLLSFSALTIAYLWLATLQLLRVL